MPLKMTTAKLCYIADVLRSVAAKDLDFRWGKRKGSAYRMFSFIMKLIDEKIEGTTDYEVEISKCHIKEEVVEQQSLF